MNYAEAVDFLYNLEHGSIKLGLERIEAAMDALGSPHRRFRSVHIAGTNGKGSTAAFLAAMAEAAGFKTALHTSPHLQVYGERFRISGRMMSEEAIASLATELKPLILECKLSFFEATTALAFEAFARERVDVAVIEVGMGGRLDATNVLAPALAVITGIDLDHVKSLGATVQAIAAEKAGIVKPGTPLLYGPCSEETARVFAYRCEQVGAEAIAVDQRVTLEDSTVGASGSRYRYRHVDEVEPITRHIRLSGRHQVWNALLAEEGARLLAAAGLAIDARARERGLAEALWPGRFEFARAGDASGEPLSSEYSAGALSARSGVRSAAPIILDVAHNPSGGQTVVDTYRACFPDGPAPVLIVGMLGDKDHEAFLRSLRVLGDELLLVPLDVPRAGPIEDVAAAAGRSGFEPRICSDLPEALIQVRCGDRPAVVTGSFRTIEAAMHALGMAPVPLLYPDAASIAAVNRSVAPGGDGDAGERGAVDAGERGAVDVAERSAVDAGERGAEVGP